MDATGISHIAICVDDLDKSLAFYRDILGMKVTLDQVQDTTQGGLPHVYKHPRQTRRTVHVRYGEGNTTPSLVLTSHPGDQTDGAPIKLDQVGISHLSFTVRDVKALAEELVSKGVQLAGPMDSFTNAQGDVSSIFVYDPDGILVQFDSVGGG
jgi:catechol 2,3-dioxygenase-like lactoylglutathione lyase family enzyme